ncbi:MAG TPA: DUF6580 family putative transport protein [Patescibacteria group bacterium]|nr:DUF6580 family putative transport protein [Patescibacteria group bacterium]
MKKTNQTLPYLIMAAAVASRFLPHPPNFTAVGAGALYGGRYFRGPIKYFVPLGAMLISDIFLGWHRTIPFVYGALLFNVWLGARIARQPKWYNIVGGAAVSSAVFYLVTNFGVWLVGSWYPHTVAGLVNCYVLALPFARWTLAGDLAFTVVFFGLTETIRQRTAIISSIRQYKHKLFLNPKEARHG